MRALFHVYDSVGARLLCDTTCTEASVIRDDWAARIPANQLCQDCVTEMGRRGDALPPLRAAAAAA